MLSLIKLITRHDRAAVRNNVTAGASPVAAEGLGGPGCGAAHLPHTPRSES